MERIPVGKNAPNRIKPPEELKPIEPLKNITAKDLKEHPEWWFSCREPKKKVITDMIYIRTQ